MLVLYWLVVCLWIICLCVCVCLTDRLDHSHALLWLLGGGDCVYLMGCTKVSGTHCWLEADIL